jgi:hypothetical protein
MVSLEGQMHRQEGSSGLDAPRQPQQQTPDHAKVFACGVTAQRRAWSCSGPCGRSGPSAAAAARHPRNRLQLREAVALLMEQLRLG